MGHNLFDSTFLGHYSLLLEIDLLVLVVILEDLLELFGLFILGFLFFILALTLRIVQSLSPVVCNPLQIVAVDALPVRLE